MSTNQIGIDGAGSVIAAAHVSVRTVSSEAPWRWLKAGWRDMWAVPRVSLSYGALSAVAAATLLLGLASVGWESLMPAVGGCFLMIGPLVAVGLYEASRRLQRGERPRLADVAVAGLAAPGQFGFMGALLMLACYAWLQLAFLLFMLFLGTSSLPPASEFLSTLLFTPRGLGLLFVGSLVGAAVALGVFALSVVAAPLMLERPVDVVTAMATSFEAVRQNPKPMALWAVLIAGFMLMGLATAFIGLIFVFPLIGHASWHAYKDVVADGAPPG